MIIGGWAFIVLGVGLMILLTHSIIKASASKDWPSVWGELQSSGIHSVTVKTRNAGRKSAMGGDKVKCLYSYVVDGQSYLSKRVTFSDYVVKTQSALNRILGQHENRSMVKVYYNPKKPGDSVLIPGVSIYNITPYVTAILFSGTGVAIVFFSEEAIKLLRQFI